MITSGVANPDVNVNVYASMDMNPEATSAGTANVHADGVIALDEVVGTLRVGTITSTLAAPSDGSNTVSLYSYGATVGSNIVFGSGSSVSAGGPVEIAAEGNIMANQGATITSPSAVQINLDFLRSNAAKASGSTLIIAGVIKAPTETIIQNVATGGVPTDDVIGINNVQAATSATIFLAGGASIVTLGSLFPFGNGHLAAIAGPISVIGSGTESLNLDDTADASANAGSQATLQSNSLTGLGMARGVTYARLKALELVLGTASQTVDIRSSNATTTSTIVSQVDHNTWDVGSLAPTLGGGVLAGIKGPVILKGGGSATKLDDTLNFDDTGSGLDYEVGNLTDNNLSGLGMGSAGVTFSGIGTMNIKLDPKVTVLQGKVANNLPALTTITGGAAATDEVAIDWAKDFNGTLRIHQADEIYLDVAGQFYGALSADKPAVIDSLVVGGSVNVGSSITTGTIDTLTIGKDLDINLNLLTPPPSSPTTPTLGTGFIGGTLPDGVTLTSASIGSLTVGGDKPATPGAADLAGTVNSLGNVGALDDTYGKFTTTAKVEVVGDLANLAIGQAPGLSIGQDMAGLVHVQGTLGTATIDGGTPGLFEAGHVGTIGSYGGFGPIVLRVIEAGVQRWLEEDAPSGITLTANSAGTVSATSPYINTKDFYESAGFASPQVGARITNPVNASARDQFDLSTVVFQDGASYNLDRLDSAGASGIGNVAVEGSLITAVSANSARFFAGGGTPGGVDLPSDKLAGVAVRDYAPPRSIVASAVESVAFGSYTGTAGSVTPGDLAAPSDAATLLGPGTAIIGAASLQRFGGAETFRVPFADLPGQHLAFFLGASGSAFDARPIDFDLESSGDGVHPATTYPATRGAVTAFIDYETAFNPGVDLISLHGDGGSIDTQQPIDGTIISTGPLGDVNIQSTTGIDDVTAPSIFGNVSSTGPIYGVVQTTGLRTDPVTGVVSKVEADLGRIYVVPASGRVGTAYVTSTLIHGGGADSLQGRIISRGNLLSTVRSDGGATGLIAVQGDLGAATAQPFASISRVGGVLINGAFGGQIVVEGDVVGDLTFNGGLVGGRVAVLGGSNTAPVGPDAIPLGPTGSGVSGNVTVDRGLNSSGGVDASSAIVTAGNIGSGPLGTKITAQDGNSGIIAAIKTILGAANGTGLFVQDPSSTSPDAAAIDAIFTDGGVPLTFDLGGENLEGLNLILADLAALHVGAGGILTGPKK